MIKKNSTIEKEYRSHERVLDNRFILWNVVDSRLKGQGRVKNISASGMMLEARSPIQPNRNDLYFFDADLGNQNYVPQTGRVVWSKKKNRTKDQFICGVEFVEPSDFVLTKLKKRIQKKINRRNALKYFVGMTCILGRAGVIGLLTYAMVISFQIYGSINEANQRMVESGQQQAALTQSYNYRYQASQMLVESLSDELETTKTLYEENQILLKVNRIQLAEVNKELESTKAILAQTEELLTQARSGNQTLKNNVNSLQGDLADLKELNEQEMLKTKAELENAIVLLEQQNEQIQSEMKEVQKQLNYYNGEVDTIDEANRLMDFYKKSMRSMSKKIKHFQVQAMEAKKDAMRERDRVQSVLGNNGFLMKNGQTVTVDENKYQLAENLENPAQLISESAVVTSSQTTATQPQAPKASVDVQFVE
ncbi:MAG: PilZ domain-containing protein [Candidatus Omnitrophica bacterium]|nr:PilZ domain-containing protein [Candidatus Omnitrophota bacterium]